MEAKSLTKREAEIAELFAWWNLTAYYTNKNISVSYLRAKKKADTKRVVALYGDGSEKYW